MAAVPAEDVGASFLFVGDLNGHHQEWLGSTTTNRHGVAAFDFTYPSNISFATLKSFLVLVPIICRNNMVSDSWNHVRFVDIPFLFYQCLDL